MPLAPSAPVDGACATVSRVELMGGMCKDRPLSTAARGSPTSSSVFIGE